MEILHSLSSWIIGILGGISITAVVGYLLWTAIKGIINRIFSTQNIKRIYQQTSKDAIEEVKTISFEQSIQPALESELVKVTEAANKYIERSYKEFSIKLDKLTKILIGLVEYFDNSVGVPEEAKAKLHESIKDALVVEAYKPQKIHIEQVKSVEETKEIKQENNSVR